MRYVIFALVAAVIVYIYYRRAKAKRLESRCRDAWKSVYGDSPQSPAFEMKYLYGWPAFTITFPTQEAWEAAAAQGLDEAFKQAIGEVCGDLGSADQTFDPDRAVFFTYQGRTFESSVVTWPPEPDHRPGG